MYDSIYTTVFQVSLRSDWDISAHLALGEALSTLRDEGVLIVTSGQTTHMSTRDNPSSSPPAWAKDFRNWINDVICNNAHSVDDKKRMFLATGDQDSFHQAHPTMDHYLPIPVASAASGYNKATLLFEQYVMGSLLISHYLFE